jgi:hypothetical protein
MRRAARELDRAATLTSSAPSTTLTTSPHDLARALDSVALRTSAGAAGGTRSTPG